MGPPHTHYNTHTLEMVQRRAARYVCNRWHNTSSVTGMLSQLEWVPMATRRANTRPCMMYRVAHTPVGDPWTAWLTFAQRTTRGSHEWKYIPISTSHDAYKFSFLPRTIIAWNQLPSIIITAPSLEAYRSILITSQPQYINPTRTRSMHKQIAQSTLHPTIALFIVLSPLLTSFIRIAKRQPYKQKYKFIVAIITNTTLPISDSHPV